MQIEIVGGDAIRVTEELLAIEGIEGSYEVIKEVEREGTLATIATVIGITTGAITIAEKLYALKSKKPTASDTPNVTIVIESPKPPQLDIEKIMLVGKNGERLLLKDASLEQLKQLIEKEKS